ncbi:polyprenyl synthetase family protein [Cellulomonas hominis]|uniref:polyprenyl synthetase family protein n=1 Tax=Cellulomonas hominis TaxID=156981 RepID=UPI001444066F|nr:polyprenyl synthetase family protein [Cellulomonas hominis]MBU5423129.1 polyprenyl synthetase family protein [Cellulomonas hominis]NKY11060.1 polyprenyl synthetase family protein [Cellulomonas hominis]
MSPAPALVDVEDLRTRVDALLTAHVEGLVPELAASGAGAAPLADELGRMLGGGKRLRAAFCYWSWRAHGGAPGSTEADVVLRVGAALELFQAAALFHDDVMDDSDTRRGRPSAHRRFAALHADEQWSGDPRRFGESAAILLGDLALVASEREFVHAVADLDPGRRARAHAVFERMRTEVTVGQYLDLLAQVLPWGDDPAADEARAREVIVAKTARYSVENPLLLGAVLAGADEVALESIRGYGLPLGEAFQLRDDLLGVFGDPEATGKPAGDDLREGKRTVLVARAMGRAVATGDAELADALHAGLGDRGLDDASCRALADRIAGSGAVAEVEDLIAGLGDRAFAALAAAPLAEDGRDMLVRLAHAAVDRRA